MADMSMQINADPAELWDLYTTIGEVKSMADEECEELLRALEKLAERLAEKKEMIQRQIQDLEAQAAQLKRKAQNSESGSSEDEELAQAIRSRIQQLEMLCAEMKKYASKVSSCKAMIEKGKKAYTASLRGGRRKVNRYIRFLEELMEDEDFDAYQESKQSAAAGDSNGSSGGFHKMTFRGVDFYGDDSKLDLSQTDGRGRTNLQRMQRGLAPVGSDGLPMNLHHMQQSQQRGGIMELPESVHKENHGALHINTNDIPSGINRSTFNVLKSSYWKRRAAFIKREQGL